MANPGRGSYPMKHNIAAKVMATGAFRHQVHKKAKGKGSYTRKGRNAR